LIRKLIDPVCEQSFNEFKDNVTGMRIVLAYARSGGEILINKWNLAEIIKYTILVSAFLYLVPWIGSSLFQNKYEEPDTITLVDSKLEIHKNRSHEAFIQCNKWVVQDVGELAEIEFLSNDYKAWNLSSGRYLIQSQFWVKDETGDNLLKEYACRIQFIASGEWQLQGLNLKDS